MARFIRIIVCLIRVGSGDFFAVCSTSIDASYVLSVYSFVLALPPLYSSNNRCALFSSLFVLSFVSPSHRHSPFPAPFSQPCDSHSWESGRLGWVTVVRRVGEGIVWLSISSSVIDRCGGVRPLGLNTQRTAWNSLYFRVEQRGSRKPFNSQGLW